MKMTIAIVATMLRGLILSLSKSIACKVSHSRNVYLSYCMYDLSSTKGLQAATKRKMISQVHRHQQQLQIPQLRTQIISNDINLFDAIMSVIPGTAQRKKQRKLWQLSTISGMKDEIVLAAIS